MSDDEQQYEQEEEQEPEPAPSGGGGGGSGHIPDAYTEQTARPQGDRCPRCGERAYHAESISMEGYKFHKRCFSCKDCKKKLDSTNANSHEGEVYCKSCHCVRFGPKGYGYGLGAGALTRTQ